MIMILINRYYYINNTVYCGGRHPNGKTFLIALAET
jgi:hypothetical protein